ncbi:hypothetical protein J2S43_003191 [Catenuloplanes nepalensis]|uniref:Uncharacterized protein n=1 Tax=Catenuloplanes nepalensis TaxID=587533 RepID=A0ABT9MTB5_9ACTN|nr:hypothetical protein [Catenuloplanes nepalensis]MDP9794679.1 hypothetical protein [Catenuloplanes nepalensis]
MGDVSRHRDIFLFTRDSMPDQLLTQSRLTRDDLSFLEIGNYLTDVSQFRDPVTFIFAKQRVWRDQVIPKVARRVNGARAGVGIAAALVAVGGAVALLAGEKALGTAAAATGLGVGLADLLLSPENIADLRDADGWLDRMLGVPPEQVPPGARNRDELHYGLVGEFFRYGIEGVTHLLFARNVTTRVRGGWGSVTPVAQSRLTEVFTEFFTQYWPHEHTDQPPYVWDASRRPAATGMYGPGRRGRSLTEPDAGVMNAVDTHYVGYLGEELALLEADWRALRPDDAAGRQRALVRMGKLLHGVEDWYFHSNAIELLHARAHTPRQGEAENDEAFLERFVRDVTGPDFGPGPTGVRMRRKLFRRLRFPVYERGDRIQSGGKLSRTAPSTPVLRFAYPAFPSSQDTATTLLHPLENLEAKILHPGGGGGGGNSFDRWAPCLLQRLATAPDGAATDLRERIRRTGALTDAALTAASRAGGPAQQAQAASANALREWVPLVVTLLDESERRRLLANVPPHQWPPADPASVPPHTGDENPEVDAQLRRHADALKPRETEGGRRENNYQRAARYLAECGYINAHGRDALIRAFDIDARSQALLADAPGAGGFLMTFALELQQSRDDGERAAARLDQDPESVKGRLSDNTSFAEHVGSHSLMSKDTTTSAPFFQDTVVLASVASSCVMTVMLEQVSGPVTTGRRLVWEDLLHHLIRLPPENGWERQSLTFHGANNRIPTLADLPELARVAAAARRPAPPVQPGKQSKRTQLELLYRRLETTLSGYRHP